ncbi:MAG: arsenate reductase [Paraglaciecola sp.]|jgi:arsenate reductase
MVKILYICTHNRCRSILSEAITNHLGAGKIVAKSAGSQPTGAVHPLSIKYLNEAGIATDGLCSQSWDEFATFAPDVVITVCDAAGAEACPLWFGESEKVHWALQDPSKMLGSEAQIADAFNATIAEITQRVQALLTLNTDPANPADLSAALRALGAK